MKLTSSVVAVARGVAECLSVLPEVSSQHAAPFLSLLSFKLWTGGGRCDSTNSKEGAMNRGFESGISKEAVSVRLHLCSFLLVAHSSSSRVNDQAALPLHAHVTHWVMRTCHSAAFAGNLQL